MTRDEPKNGSAGVPLGKCCQDVIGQMTLVSDWKDAERLPGVTCICSNPSNHRSTIDYRSIINQTKALSVYIIYIAMMTKLANLGGLTLSCRGSSKPG